MKIWKYTIEVTDLQHLMMPAGATLLTVQRQGKETCLWALVDDTSTDHRVRRIAIYGTGHPMPDYSPTDVYVGTFQVPIEAAATSSLVFHVFDLGELA